MKNEIVKDIKFKVLISNNRNALHLKCKSCHLINF